MTGKGLDDRRRRHHANARRGGCLPIHTAIRKYGEALQWKVLHELEDEDLAYILEAEIIAKDKPNLNVAKGGRTGWATGMKHTADTKAKMSAAKIGKPARNKGSKHTAESIEKMRIAKSANPSRHWLGKKLSPEHAKKCGQKRHPIVCLTDGMRFPSARDAAENYGERIGSVHEAVRLSVPLHGRRFVREKIENGD